MKTVFVIVSLLAVPVFAARGVNVAQLPDSEFADTEVVTERVREFSVVVLPNGSAILTVEGVKDAVIIPPFEGVLGGVVG